jgi:glycosyltransferase involved in cell wall biosynthesis
VRIGIDTHAAEQDGTGNGSYVRGLVRALTALDGDDEYVLYAIDPAHPFYRTLESRTAWAVRRLWPRPAAVRIPLALALASYRDRLDALHVQYVGPPWHRGARIVTLHDLAFLRVPESFPRLQRWRLRWLVPANARRAAAVIVGSEYSRREVQATYGIACERISVIRDAPDPRFRPVRDDAVLSDLRQRLGIRGRYLLYVGRLNPRKNIPGLLRAFEQLRPRLREPLQLVIAGQPDFRTDRLEANIAASPWRADVVRAGFVRDDDLPALYSGATVFVFPSFLEGFGLPPLEAMACGTPVVCADATSLPEVVGDAGLLVHPGDVDAMAAALLRILGEPDLRASLAERALQRAAQFTWRAAAQHTLEVYRRVRAASPPLG